MLVGYARVSTREQNHALQLDAFQAAGCGRVYTEKASGAQCDRPELKAALDYAREGDTLIVWKLDRLARSIRQLIETFEDLKRRKIGLRSLTEATDTTTAGGRLVFHVFAALAEFERSVVRERTTAGLEVACARGRRGGRPRRLSPADLAAATALLRNQAITVEGWRGGWAWERRRSIATCWAGEARWLRYDRQRVRVGERAMSGDGETRQDETPPFGFDDVWPDDKPFPLSEAECARLVRGHPVRWRGTLDDAFSLPGMYEMMNGWLYVRRS